MALSEQAAANKQASSRFGWLDSARGIAVIAMTIFHFTWDLEYFGYAPAGLTSEPGWRWFARAIAASFLLLVGFSFVLAHKNGLRWPAFLKRSGQIIAAALLITLSTWWMTPDRFVFFGILHQIAAASLLAAILLPLPWQALALLSATLFAVNATWTHEIFQMPTLWWVGLAPTDPPTNDYVPVFPWTGWVLAGMAAAKMMLRFGMPSSSTAGMPNAAVRGVQFLGRHSLIYYLLHQPVMIGLLSGLTFIVPPPAPDIAANFTRACISGCTPDRAENYCQRFCDCVTQDLAAKSILEPVAKGSIPVDDMRVADAAQACTLKADNGSGE